LQLEEIKLKYNKLLEREHKAEEWMQKASSKEVDKWLPNYTEIAKQLSNLMEEYKITTGEDMTEKQISNGFNISFKDILTRLFDVTVYAIENTTDKEILHKCNRILNLLSELSKGDGEKDGDKKV